MRKHIYLNMNIEDIRELCDDPLFIPVHEYDSTLREKQHQYESGLIKTESNFYHILVGNIPIKDCPWCGNLCSTRIDEVNPEYQSLKLDYKLLYKICTNCGAQGPKIKIHPDMLIDKTFFNEMEYLLDRNFQNRISWIEQFNLGEKND